MRILVEPILASVQDFFTISYEQMESFTYDFMGRLPEYLQRAFGYQAAA